MREDLLDHLERGMIDNGVYMFAYFNNHFAGHAPESLEMFRRLWSEGQK